MPCLTGSSTRRKIRVLLELLASPSVLQTEKPRCNTASNCAFFGSCTGSTLPFRIARSSCLACVLLRFAGANGRAVILSWGQGGFSLADCKGRAFTPRRQSSHEVRNVRTPKSETQFRAFNGEAVNARRAKRFYPVVRSLRKPTWVWATKVVGSRGILPCGL